jgi:hypothetical protein
MKPFIKTKIYHTRSIHHTKMKKKKKNKYIIINSTTIEVSRNAIHHSTKIEYEIEISIWKSVINNQIFEVK